jgi:hypothetical protein
MKFVKFRNSKLGEIRDGMFTACFWTERAGEMPEDSRTDPYVSGQHFSGFSTFSFEQLTRGAEKFLCGCLTLGRWTSSDGVV